MKNKHRVPVKQWNKWSKSAQATFNDVRSETKDEKSADVASWNAAWIAADLVNEYDTPDWEK